MAQKRSWANPSDGHGSSHGVLGGASIVQTGITHGMQSLINACCGAALPVVDRMHGFSCAHLFTAFQLH
jgi:hypothetical protein